MDALLTCVRADGTPSAEVGRIPVPVPASNELLIAVHAVALNPVDALYVAHLISRSLGRVVGSDIAGVVVAVGEAVSDWNVGDRAAAFLQGACSTNDRPGGFAQYAVTASDLAIRIPSGVSFEQAATLPLCSLTSAQALRRLGLLLPFQQGDATYNPAILVYGASTSIGLYAVQLAKMCRTASGNSIRVFATASSRNHDLLRSLGVDGVVDYRSPDWPREIVKLSGGITHAYDCISEGDSTGKISETFVPQGGQIAVIRKAAFDNTLIRQGVEALYGAVWSGLGVEIGYNGATIPADPALRRFTTEFFRFLSTNTDLPIKPNPIRIMPGGLASIVRDGFALLGSATVNARANEKLRTEDYMRPISAEKLVYQIA